MLRPRQSPRLDFLSLNVETMSENEIIQVSTLRLSPRPKNWLRLRVSLYSVLGPQNPPIWQREPYGCSLLQLVFWLEQSAFLWEALGQLTGNNLSGQYFRYFSSCIVFPVFLLCCLLSSFSQIKNLPAPLGWYWL